MIGPRAAAGAGMKSCTAPLETVLFLFFSAILLLIYYLSCNMASIYDGIITAASRRERLSRLGSLALVTAVAMSALYHQILPVR